MNTSDFKIPDHHPYDMLAGYTNAYEKETVLSVILKECLEAGFLFRVVETQHSHPTMVEDGLLERNLDDYHYRLTKKALGLLYSEYHA